MLIRPLTDADFQQWLELRLALWPYYRREYLASESRELLAQPERVAVFVAQADDGALIGFAEASIRYYADGCESRNVGYLEGWYVAAAHRRQGIGRRLVQAAEELARSKGCQEMASDCHLDNAVSEQAHGKLGFEETERLIHFRKPL